MNINWTVALAGEFLTGEWSDSACWLGNFSFLIFTLFNLSCRCNAKGKTNNNLINTKRLKVSDSLKFESLNTECAHLTSHGKLTPTENRVTFSLKTEHVWHLRISSPHAILLVTLKKAMTFREWHLRDYFGENCNKKRCNP